MLELEFAAMNVEVLIGERALELGFESLYRLDVLFVKLESLCLKLLEP